METNYLTFLVLSVPLTTDPWLEVCLGGQPLCVEEGAEFWVMVEEKEAEEVEGTTTCLAVPAAGKMGRSSYHSTIGSFYTHDKLTWGCTWP